MPSRPAWSGFWQTPERGANPDNALFSVTYQGATEGCELLDRYGANWEQAFDGRTGRTPLMDLMVFKKPRGSVWLIARGVNVRATDASGKTALHYAAAQGVRADLCGAVARGGG